MKKLIVPVLILLGLAACRKHEATPKYVEEVIYSGDSVRYSFDSLPAVLPTAPEDYEASDYYKVVQVYTNGTMTVDYTHILPRGMSVAYRAFVRYDSTYYDMKGWYRRRISNGYIIPANREVVIYRTVPYNSSADTTSLGDLVK